MAVRNGTAEWTDRLYRSANVPSYDAAYTVMVWFRIITAPDSYSYATLWSLRNEPAGTWFQDAVNIFNYPGVGLQLDFYGKNDSTVVEFLGTATLSLNTWYCAALVRTSDTDRKIYIGDASNVFAQDGASTSPLGSRAANPAAEANICESRSGVLEVGAVKVWTTALTLTQLQGEQYYDLAQYETNIRFVIPVVDTGAGRGTDYSGNSYAFTTNGTMTDVADPAAVSWDAATGTDVTVLAGAVVALAIAPAASVATAQNVTISAGEITALATAPAASVLAVQNVTVAADGILAQALAPEATIVAVQKVDISADGVLAWAVSPAAVVEATQNVSIEAGSVLAFGLVGAGSVSTVEAVNATIQAGAVTASAIVFDAATVTEINVMVVAGSCVSLACAPGAVVDAQRNIAIAAGDCLALGVVGQAEINLEIIVVILALCGELHMLASVEGGIHARAQVWGNVHMVENVEGEAHTKAAAAGDVHTVIDLEGEIL